VDTIAVDLNQAADRARAIATVGEAFRLGLRQLVVSSQQVVDAPLARRVRRRRAP
jgi:hypothetical protein